MPWSDAGGGRAVGCYDTGVPIYKVGYSYPTAPFSRNVGFKNPTYAADNVLIGRLKMTSQISWLLYYFQTAFLLF